MPVRSTPVEVRVPCAPPTVRGVCGVVCATIVLPRLCPLQIPWETDEEVIDLVNDCPFGLGSNVFSGSKKRANAIAARLEAGMSTINDFATTYMCQSLPFGGVKLSGFDRFAGVEGLRGLCIPKASPFSAATA